MQFREEFGVARVVDAHVDDGDAGFVQRLLERGLELADTADPDTFGAERRGEVRDVIVAELDSRGAPVFELLLKRDHVIGVVTHDDMSETEP